jgi:isoquinoline 1-oxidoreductase beta subunit
MPPAAPEPVSSVGLTRRGFLQVSAAVGGGLLLGIELAPAIAGVATEHKPFAPNAFIRIDPDDSITLIMPAVEMGQGSYTMLAALLAEELDADLKQVKLEHAPPDQAKYANPALGVQATGGSTTTMAWFLPIRRAGAVTRSMLAQAAAALWRVDASTLSTANGTVAHPLSGREIRYGSLAESAATRAVPADVALKDRKNYKLIGRTIKRLDTPDKVAGKAVFGIDARLPGMAVATLASCPVLGGCVRHVDDAQALTVPGVRQVVVLDDLVAVVGDHMWAAKCGLSALKVEWDAGANAGIEQDDLWRELEQASLASGVVAQRSGDAGRLVSQGEVLEASYELPFLAHAPMEPMNCTVHARADGCDVWVGTQVPGFAQAGAAQVLGLRPDQVTVHNHLIGGGFGRRLEIDGVIKAVRIAQKVTGPVKVVWTREEDIQQEIYRPMYRDRIRARLDNGKVVAWHHRVTGPSILARWLPPAFKDGIDADAVEGAIKPPYDFPNVLVEYVRHETPVPVGFWRGVGPNSNVFSAECFLDLLARKSHTDPLTFRRNMLQHNSRALAVLDLAAEKAAWGYAPGSTDSSRTGRGIALLVGFGSFLAAVAEVSVNDAGDVRVSRIVCAADVGTVVNPDGVAAQIQGGTIFGMGTILYDSISIFGGRVRQSNFHDYRLPRINEIPRIETYIVPSTESPGGIGEPGTVVIQPAISNAVFAATGIQPTRMPIDRKALVRKSL